MTPQARLLLLGPADDPKRILESLKHGADEFLDRTQVEDELSGALRRVQTSGRKVDHGPSSGRVIAVLAPSGGSGASTLAAGISAALAQKHSEAGLIDLRLGVADQDVMLNVKPTRTLADVCENLARLDKSLFEQSLTRHASGIHLLAAPVSSTEADKVTDKGLRRAMALARVRFPYVVVDMSNVFTPEQVEALWQADRILLVTRLDYTSVRNTRRMIDTITELGISRYRIKLVLNACGQRRQLGVKQAEEAIGMKALQCVPYDPAVVHSAVNNGEPIVTRRRFSKINRVIHALSISVNGSED